MPNSETRVLFRVDANLNMGAGHLMRCISLAYAFTKLGHQILFIVSKETSDLILTLDSFEFDYLSLDVPEKADQEVINISSKNTHPKSLIVVLDGYWFDTNYLNNLKKIGLVLVVLDDENNRGPLPCDVIINSTESGKLLGYQSSAPKALHLLGRGYALLRPEFQSPDENHAADRSDLFVCFGASDVADLTLPIVDELIKHDELLRNLSIVTGPAYAFPELVKQKVSNYQAVQYHHNASNMASLMAKAKLAISASGGTIFELLSLGVPSILVVVANNQLAAAREHESLGWCKVIDAREGLDLKAITSLALKLWSAPLLLENMRQKACALDVRGGALRAVRAIIQLQKRKAENQASVLNAYGVCLREVQYTDIERIRSWRNDPLINNMMFDQTYISVEQQKDWFSYVSSSTYQQHFLIEYKSQAIGIINIKSLDKKMSLGEAKIIEPGLYIAEPRYRGNVLAFCPSLAVLDYCFEELACEQIVARVLRNNESAIKYNKALGYSFSAEEQKQAVEADDAFVSMYLNYSAYCCSREAIKKALRIK